MILIRQISRKYPSDPHDRSAHLPSEGRKLYHLVVPPAYRHDLTEEEAILWSELRVFRGKGFAFRRQVKIGPFQVDFLCRKAKLIIEVDGNHHAYSDQQWEHDRDRDDWLRSRGYQILRIWNHDVRTDLDNVIRQIEDTAHARL